MRDITPTVSRPDDYRRLYIMVTVLREEYHAAVVTTRTPYAKTADVITSKRRYSELPTSTLTSGPDTRFLSHVLRREV